MQNINPSSLGPESWVGESFLYASSIPLCPEGQKNLTLLWQLSRDDCTHRVHKKGYKILNDLERKGLKEKLKELEQRFAKEGTVEAELALLKTRLFEMGSCFQVVKNKWNEDKEIIQQKNIYIASLQEQLQREQMQRTEQNARLQDLQKEVGSKKRKLAELEEQIPKLHQSIKNDASLYDSALDRMAQLEIELYKTLRNRDQEISQYNERIAALQEELCLERSSREKIQTEYIKALEEMKQKEQMLEQLTKLKVALGNLLEEEQNELKKAHQDTLNLNQTLITLEKQLEEKNLQLNFLSRDYTEQKSCLEKIKVAIEHIHIAMPLTQ